jgi:pimeloyl-[acyl-carrier protein] methyl ester esterase
MTNLVFLHGWGTSGHIWRRQTEAFARAGLTVLTPTLPSWEVSWLVDYLKKLPLAETVLVGWSLGGMLLLEALSQGTVTPGRLVLVATPACFCAGEDHPVGQPRAAVRALRRTVRQDPRRGLADFGGRCLAPGEADFREEILENFQYQDTGADLASGLDYLLNTDLRPQLAGIRARTLIIQGDEDAIVPQEQAEILSHYLKEAQVVRLPGAGHAPFVTRAEAFNEVVAEFLREEARGRRPLPPQTPSPNP